MRHSISYITAPVCFPCSTDDVISGCTATTYDANTPISQDCSTVVVGSCQVPHQIHFLDRDEPSSFGTGCIHAAQERYRVVGN